LNQTKSYTSASWPNRMGLGSKPSKMPEQLEWRTKCARTT
jgi:hypothetical protein